MQILSQKNKRRHWHFLPAASFMFRAFTAWTCPYLRTQAISSAQWTVAMAARITTRVGHRKEIISNAGVVAVIAARGDGHAGKQNYTDCVAAGNTEFLVRPRLTRVKNSFEISLATLTLFLKQPLYRIVYASHWGDNFRPDSSATTGMSWTVPVLTGAIKEHTLRYNDTFARLAIKVFFAAVIWSFPRNHRKLLSVFQKCQTQPVS